MLNPRIRQYLLSIFCCVTFGLVAACESQGPVKKNDNTSAKQPSDSADKTNDNAVEETPSDDSAEMHDDHDGEDHDSHDHDGHNHDGEDQDGHDHDGHSHDGHDHDSHAPADDDVATSPDEPETMAALPSDFTMNLDNMPTTKLVDPAEVIDSAELGIPIHPSGMKSNTNKQAMEDLIYANIRIRMDSDMALRRAMIDKGVAPTDPGIRQLEGQIRKARELLEQSGESLEPIDPPIQ